MASNVKILGYKLQIRKSLKYKLSINDLIIGAALLGIQELSFQVLISEKQKPLGSDIHHTLRQLGIV